MPRVVDEEACDQGRALALLNQRPWVEQALLLAAPINEGARVLWETPHAVLAAPYHRNAEGLRDHLAIFGQEEGVARATALRRGVDFILLCPTAQPSPPAVVTRGGFQDLLGAGKLPDWLEFMPETGTARLLRVR